MPITIGSNIASLKTQRQLAKTSNELASVYERLSSGMRINKASDDAAGLSIASQLNSDRRVFNQGIRNFNDGISLLNIADSAIESLTNIVIRLKELAEQSANGTYSSVQRNAIDKEAQALSKEYTRIIQTTKFNGMGLLDGGLGTGLRLQGGYGTSGSIFAGIGGAKGTGSFSSGMSFDAGGVTSEILSGDFNGDGIADIAAADYTNGRIDIFIGTGSGSFGAAVSYQTSALVRSLSMTDLNQDGLTDIVSGGLGSTNINILLGNANGTFNAGITLSNSAGTASVRTGDFNGDGFSDIVNNNSISGELSIFYGNGNGSFQARRTATILAFTSVLTTGDFNGDGITDIVSGAYGGSDIAVMIGSSSGTFSRSLISVGANPYSVETGDFNGDGVDDLAVSNYNDAAIGIMISNGNGTFGSMTNYVTGGGPYHSDTGDFNNDGILDIVSASYTTGAINVLIGRGNGTFNSSTSFSSSTGSRHVSAADLNNDGVLDVVAGSQYTNSFQINFANTREGTSTLLAFDLKSLSSSRQAINAFDVKISQLAKQRGQIGAFQSRVEVGINNLQAASENYAIAESRIRDADIAAEAANLVRLQILQKAGAAVLAQANIQPSLALKLLGGK